MTAWWLEREDIVAHLRQCVRYSHDFRHPDDIFVLGWQQLTPVQQDRLVILRLKVQANVVSDDPRLERPAFCEPD